jgi:hypothetical protein
MIRNLKIFAAAAFALATFGAIGAPGVQAAHEFHCSANPCRFRVNPDGTGTTAHQVLIIENAATTESVPVTCERFTGDATVNGNTATAITLTGIAYDNCKAFGSIPAFWDLNGCEYTYTTPGGTTDQAELHVFCPTGKEIEVTSPEVACTFKIPPQTLIGVGYHILGPGGTREITVTKKIHGIAVTATAGCAPLINPNQTLAGTYTTGNFLLTGETTGEVRADAWFL